MKTYMFPGQGSQTKGMGGALFDHFKELTAQADALLGYSIRELCLEDPRNELNQTQFTQPALYMVNALTYLKKLEEDGRAPDFLVGHSLGEFSALLAAGCFDFETGLKLVQKRGELMSKAQGGAMAAVLNASRDSIEEILSSNGLDQVFLANYNSPSQIVISGAAEQLAKAQPLLAKGKVRFFPLNTSGAFHSKFMQGAMEEFGEFLKSVTLTPPQTPVIANVTARPYGGDAILDTLKKQIANTVQWSESVQYLLALARSRGDSMTFDELGPGDVLTRLVEAIRKQTPEDFLDALIPVAAKEASTKEMSTQEGSTHEGSTREGSTESAARPLAAVDKVADWNRRFPVGSKVKSTALNYPQLETRSEAQVLFGHRAAVYMKGYNGYFDLEELAPL